MGFKEVGGARLYPKFKDCTKGDVLIEGRYIRDFQGKYGVQFEFESINGDIVVLNGSGQLKYKMDFVRPDSKVKIIYDGKIILEKGPMKGKESHQFTVMCDDDFTAEDVEAASDGSIDDFGDL